MPPGDLAMPLTGSTRARPTLLLIVAAALLVARVGAGVFDAKHPSRLPDLVSWQPIEGAEANARARHQAVLYDFTADWCAPCQTMQREVFSDPDAAREINHLFVAVRVLDRTREEGRNPAIVDSLQRRFRVESFPTLVILPAGGGEPIVAAGYDGKRQTIQRLRAATVQGLLPFPALPQQGARGGR